MAVTQRRKTPHCACFFQTTLHVYAVSLDSPALTVLCLWASLTQSSESLFELSKHPYILPGQLSNSHDLNLSISGYSAMGHTQRQNMFRPRCRFPF